MNATVDLLVLGGGMAGLSAAAYAARAGADVVLVEKGPATGGSATYAGFIHTAPTLDELQRLNPGGDPVLGRRLVEGYDGALDWVRSLGVHVDDPVPVLDGTRGCQTDMANYLLACERIVRERGELLLQASAEELLVEDGAVAGAAVRTATGDQVIVRARSTLLATGGFGGDAGLRAQHLHPLAGDLPLRANVHSTGDGLRLGQGAGAAFGRPGAGFYGHLVPSHIAYTNPYEFVELTFYHGEHGIIINLDGRRFCDETLGDHLTAMAVLEQPQARALMICDQRVHEQWMLTPYVAGTEAPDKFQLAYRRGARAAIAEDVDEFEALPEEWGYPGAVVRDTLRAFNEQCRRGAPEPGRRRDREPLVDPPYYVIEVVPAITHPFGGLLIDDRARVLGDDGEPIAGLLAAGADAGGLFHRAYAGGLCAALVFGLQAARTAVPHAPQLALAQSK
jgi:succinate dehydrogenase/fumarate reductase flavoprotein subunit